MTLGFTIGQHLVAVGQPPLIIAEMSGNHNQSLQKALELVDAAADAGAHVVKLQTYTADTLTLDVHTADFMINDPDSLWHGQRLYDLYQQAHTPWDWHEAIFQRARARGLAVFSTPFDETAVDFLETLQVPAYKIASFELTHLPLIKKVAATGKPMIMSTGLASEAEIKLAVDTARQAGAQQIVLLKCTSAYPARPEDANLATMEDLKKFGTLVGLSDHTLGIGVAVASAVMGACVIEKHFTLSRAEGGVDAAFSLEPTELKSLVDETKRAVVARGQVHYGGADQEQTNRRYRQSIYVSRSVKPGDQLTRENTRIVRPGFGIAPKHWEALQGRKFCQKVAVGTALAWSMLDIENFDKA